MNDCSAPLPAHALEGLRLFNAGEYFEAHEALETAWREEAGEVRYLYQGILQGAVMYLHMQRLNYEGAVKMYDRSMKLLRPWPGMYCGVNVDKLRTDLSRAVEAWKLLGPERVNQMDWSLLKPVEWNETE
jgi:predicted metal-dependent hydrolase